MAQRREAGEAQRRLRLGCGFLSARERVRSLSENERNTISAGDWPRSTASTVSSSDPARAEEMHGKAVSAEGRRDRLAVEALLPITTRRLCPRLACPPGPVE